MLTRREILALQSMLAAGAFAGRPFDLSGIFGGTAVAQETDWDAGDLYHVLPTVNHERALLKCSFHEPLPDTPELRVDGRRIAGRRTDTRGRFWSFDVASLRPSTAYELVLRTGRGRTLAEPWTLSTFPSPDSDIEHVRVGFYHCAGGHEITAMTNGRRRSIAVRRALLQKLASFEPDAIVANGDQMYWDLYSPRFATTYAQSEEGIAYAGTYDRSRPIFGTSNEDFVLKAGVEQIAPIYRTTFRSTPVFFLQDDHDYFDNDDATDEAVTFPPDHAMLALARSVQKLAYPEFLPDPYRPHGLPGSREDEGLPEIASNYGTLRYGKLLEVLLYDNRRSATTLGPSAVHFDRSVESWLKARMADREVAHVVNAPGQPPGWTRGNWYEYYPDVVRDGQAIVSEPKPYWPSGWLSQHDRIVEAIHRMPDRIPLIISGDIHKSAHGRILRSGDLDLSSNPVVTLLPGTPGTGVSSLQAVTLPANHLDMSHEWGPEGVNGFMIGDFYRDRVECSFYGWDGRTQSVDSIADLDASHVTTIEPVA